MDKFLVTKHQKKVFTDRYQQTENETVEEMFERVVEASSIDKTILGMNKSQQKELFRSGLVNKEFTPAGRPLCNLGPNGNNMVFNCFVLPIKDSRKSITSTLADFTEIAAMGGGIGINYSTLRPKGSITKRSKGTASGPCSFIDVFQSMGRTIKQNGSRGLATMTILEINHPDIEEFISVKYEEGRWTTTNISIGITDDFIEAVKEDLDFDLVWKKEVVKTVKAKDLWYKICEYAHRNGEPGVIFLDTINSDTPYRGVVVIKATNPCQEQPLPPNGACNLGSVIVSTFVNEDKSMDYIGIEKAAYNLTIWLDNLIDVSTYPTKAIEKTVKKYRPVGVGMMGFADALFLMELPYGYYTETLDVTDKITQAINKGTLNASRDLGKDRGYFPGYNSEIMNFVPRRNITTVSYAPTGSISSLFNVSSGVEPHFALKIKRTEEIGVTITKANVVSDYMEKHNLTEPPSYARFSIDGPKDLILSVDDHLSILKIITDSCHTAVSKTVNMPYESTIEDVSDTFMYCWENGIKGCAVYRTGSRTEVPIQSVTEKPVIVPADDEEYHDEIEFINLIAKPRPIPDDIDGAGRYRLKYNPRKPSLYILMTDDDDGPLEIFFNTWSGTKDATDGMATLMTSLFRRGIECLHVLEKWKKYESSNSGGWYDGKYVASLLAGIAMVIEKHFKKMGYITETKSDKELEEIIDNSKDGKIHGERCPECGMFTLIRVGGCPTCMSCPYSECG